MRGVACAFSSLEDRVTTKIRFNETPTFGIFVTVAEDVGFRPQAIESLCDSRIAVE